MYLVSMTSNLQLSHLSRLAGWRSYRSSFLLFGGSLL